MRRMASGDAVAPGPSARILKLRVIRRQQLGVSPLFQTSLPPFAEPEQLAAAITWLASADATNVTGIALASDGGWSAR